MNDDMFPPKQNTDTFVAIVMMPNGVDCLRKTINDLYVAKLWVSDKIWGGNLKVGDKFPFGYDYCITTKDGILMPEQINLGY
jgi:hypothetical protein